MRQTASGRYSHRLEVVAGCTSAPEAQRGTDSQLEIARAIRSAAACVGERRRRLMIEDRALLIELASSADEVEELLDEVERLVIRREGER